MADAVPGAVAETAVAETVVTTVPVAAAEPVAVTETVGAVPTDAVKIAVAVSGVSAGAAEDPVAVGGAPKEAEGPAEPGPRQRGPIPIAGVEGYWNPGGGWCMVEGQP